jgi:hypothetical protein
LQSPRARTVLEKLRRLCLRLPESQEARQFGHPVWQAGKKTFAIARPEGARVDDLDARNFTAEDNQPAFNAAPEWDFVSKNHP